MFPACLKAKPVTKKEAPMGNMATQMTPELTTNPPPVPFSFTIDHVTINGVATPEVLASVFHRLPPETQRRLELRYLDAESLQLRLAEVIHSAPKRPESPVIIMEVERHSAWQLVATTLGTEESAYATLAEPECTMHVRWRGETYVHDLMPLNAEMAVENYPAMLPGDAWAWMQAKGMTALDLFRLISELREIADNSGIPGFIPHFLIDIPSIEPEDIEDSAVEYKVANGPVIAATPGQPLGLSQDALCFIETTWLRLHQRYTAQEAVTLACELAENANLALRLCLSSEVGTRQVMETLGKYSPPRRRSVLETGVVIRLDVHRLDHEGKHITFAHCLRVPVIRVYARPAFPGRSWKRDQYVVERPLMRLIERPSLKAGFRSCHFADIGELCNFFHAWGRPPKEVSVWDFVVAAEQYIQDTDIHAHEATRERYARTAEAHNEAYWAAAKARRIAKVARWRMAADERES